MTPKVVIDYYKYTTDTWIHYLLLDSVRKILNGSRGQMLYFLKEPFVFCLVNSYFKSDHRMAKIRPDVIRKVPNEFE
jgi:hypothetical protein